MCCLLPESGATGFASLDKELRLVGTASGHCGRRGYHEVLKTKTLSQISQATMLRWETSSQFNSYGLNQVRRIDYRKQRVAASPARTPTVTPRATPPRRRGHRGP